VRGDAPPPELSFAALSPRLSGTSGWIETGRFFASYAHQSDGDLVVLALPSGVTRQTGTLGRWILFLVTLNDVVSAAIIVLLSIRVHARSPCSSLRCNGFRMAISQASGVHAPPMSFSTSAMASIVCWKAYASGR
jgi:hypothetical protein